MSEKNRFSKPVAFNNKNEKDQLILKHVKRRNFSGYVKKLILEDIQKRMESKTDIEPVEEIVKVEDVEVLPKSAAEKLEELKRKAGQKPAKL